MSRSRRPQAAACPGQLDALCAGERREPEIEALEGLRNDLRDGETREPLVVRGDHVPWRGACAGLRDGLFVRPRVVLPAQPLVDVADRELPVLRGVLQALQEAPALLLSGDVQEEFPD